MAGISIGDLTKLYGVADDLLGARTNQTTSGTQRTTIDPAGMNYLFKSLLESENGLADIFQTEQEAGVYNSATSQLLANDLLARSAGEVNARNSTTVTNSSTKNKKKGGVSGLFNKTIVGRLKKLF